MGTKVSARSGRTSEPGADLEQQLEKHRRELAEGLEQQTATSEVLSVISNSPGELELVFQAMLQHSLTICEAKFGQMFLREGSGTRGSSSDKSRSNL